jgi:hypothetical protein
MPVYFRGQNALITHQQFICYHPYQEFALRELLHPHIVIAEATGASPRLTPALLLGRRSMHEVHAFYRGRRVCLFRTTDLRLFGQVRRALVRALEAQADHLLFP